MYNKRRRTSRCLVPGCRKEKGEVVSYHEYPSDPVIRAKWMKALKITKEGEKAGMMDEQPIKREHRVCSKHFQLTDYKQTSSGNPRILFRHAVPSQFPTFPKKGKKGKSKLIEEKNKNSMNSKSNCGPISNEIHHSLIVADKFDDLEFLDVDLDIDELETINFDDDLPNFDIFQHGKSIATQTDPIYKVEMKSVSVQVDADLSRERLKILKLQKKKTAMLEKIRKLSKELSEERSKSKLQLKVIEKLKKGSTLFQINSKEKKEL